MTKVLIVGDTHGDSKFVSNIHKNARSYEVDTIVQLGDFGYNFDRNLVASIAAWLSRDPEHKWYWLDGNHDHHDFIEQVILANEPAPDSPVNMGGMQFHNVEFPDRMYYLPRGSTFTIGERRCMALGGAFSIDRHYRKEFVSWWPQELIRDADVRHAIDNGKDIDVMFCHDTPPTEWVEEQLTLKGYKSDATSAYNRLMVGHVVENVHPKELYHGHYHWRYDTLYECMDGWITTVHGVGANVSQHPGGAWLDPTAIYGHNFLIEEW